MKAKLLLLFLAVIVSSAQSLRAGIEYTRVFNVLGPLSDPSFIFRDRVMEEIKNPTQANRGNPLTDPYAMKYIATGEVIPYSWLTNAFDFPNWNGQVNPTGAFANARGRQVYTVIEIRTTGTTKLSMEGGYSNLFVTIEGSADASGIWFSTGFYFGPNQLGISYGQDGYAWTADDGIYGDQFEDPKPPTFDSARGIFNGWGVYASTNGGTRTPQQAMDIALNEAKQGDGYYGINSTVTFKEYTPAGGLVATNTISTGFLVGPPPIPEPTSGVFLVIGVMELVGFRRYRTKEVV